MDCQRDRWQYGCGRRVAGTETGDPRCPAALAAGRSRPIGRPVRGGGVDAEPVAPAVFCPTGDRRTAAADGGNAGRNRACAGDAAGAGRAAACAGPRRYGQRRTRQNTGADGSQRLYRLRPGLYQQFHQVHPDRRRTAEALCGGADRGRAPDPDPAQPWQRGLHTSGG